MHYKIKEDVHVRRWQNEKQASVSWQTISQCSGSHPHIDIDSSLAKVSESYMTLPNDAPWSNCCCLDTSCEKSPTSTWMCPPGTTYWFTWRVLFRGKFSWGAIFYFGLFLNFFILFWTSLILVVSEWVKTHNLSYDLILSTFFFYGNEVQ